ncbi:ABC transporter permease [Aliihoeflea sp. PC F10.4]
MSVAAANRIDTLRPWLLSAPALVLLIGGSLVPLLIVTAFSFLEPGAYSGVVWNFTTQAWLSLFVTRDIFDDTLSWATSHIVIFWRSIWLSLMTTVVTFIVGFPTAWYIANRSPAIRPVLLFLITIPFWTNLLVRTVAINELIRNNGVLNSFLMHFNIISAPLPIAYTDTAVLIGMSYVYLPLMVMPLFASIDRFDKKLLEAAYDLYATRLQVIRRVIMPILRPGIIAGATLVFIPSLGAYVIPRVLGGGKKMMIGNFIELQFGAARNWPLGAATALFLLVLVVAIVVIGSAVAKRVQTNG